MPTLRSMASDMAKAENGQFLLRIEDIDQSRSRPHWEAQIYDDLSWLGLTWPQPVMRQSDRMGRYTTGLWITCGRGGFCIRAVASARISSPQQAPPKKVRRCLGQTV